MLDTVILIIAFSIVLNWMISLSIMSFINNDRRSRIRFGIFSGLSGIILGYIIYLL